MVGPARIQRTTYTLGGQLIGQRVRKLNNSGAELSDAVYYTLTDHLGSVAALTNSGDALVGGIIRYEPYGAYRGAPPRKTSATAASPGTGKIASWGWCT